MTSTPVFGDSRISTHADPTSSRRVIFHEWHISSVNFMLSLVYANVYIGVGVHPLHTRRFVWFWASGEQSSQNGRFCAQDTDEPPCQNLTPLALSSPEKSVMVQNYKQTVTGISTLSYRHMLMNILTCNTHFVTEISNWKRSSCQVDRWIVSVSSHLLQLHYVPLIMHCLKKVSHLWFAITSTYICRLW